MFIYSSHKTTDRIVVVEKAGKLVSFLAWYIDLVPWNVWCMCTALAQSHSGVHICEY